MYPETKRLKERIYLFMLPLTVFKALLFSFSTLKAENCVFTFSKHVQNSHNKAAERRLNPLLKWTVNIKSSSSGVMFKAFWVSYVEMSILDIPRSFPSLSWKIIWTLGYLRMLAWMADMVEAPHTTGVLKEIKISNKKKH